MPRTHLFLAMGNGAFGEVVLGLRLAHALHARGDRVLFLAPSGQSVLLRGSPFRWGVTDQIWSQIDHAIVELVATEKCDDVVLVDLTSVALALSLTGRTEVFFRTVSAVAPIIALDVWNLPATNLRWDALGALWDLPRDALSVERRIVPVPFVRPDVAGGYDSLPRPEGIDRAAARASLGLDDDARLIVTTTASWQTPRAQPDPAGQAAARTLPPILLAALAALDPRIRIVHVGPEAFEASTLADRYRWIAPQPAARFLEILAAGDLLFSLNLSATTIGAAVASGLPVVVGTSALGGTAEEIASALPSPPPPALLDWLRLQAPRAPFRVWPLGLYDFLGPIFADNPYTNTFDVVELFDLEAVRDGVARLVFDPTAAAAARARQATYVERVRELPSPVEAFDRVSP